MKIAILGAGISGLSLGYFLKKNDPLLDLKIFEQNDRVGGYISSAVNDGFVFEQGPRGIRPRGKGRAVLELIKDIGLWPEAVFAESEAGIKYIYLDGRLQKVPGSVISLFRSPITAGIGAALVKDLCLKSHSPADESLASFSRRHFGSALTENVIDPVASGVWAGDAERLSFSAVLPDLAEVEQKYGSVLLGMILRKRKVYSRERFPKAIRKAALFSFRYGMGALPGRLAECLSGHIMTSTPVMDIHPCPQGYMVYSQGKSWVFDKVISTLPSYALASLVEETNSHLAETLKKIEYAPMAIVSLGFNAKVNPYKGFGYLIPHKEKQGILGMIWNDQTFSCHSRNGASSMTVMIGGARFEKFSDYSEDDFISMSIDAVERHLEVSSAPAIKLCSIWPKAIPQYNMGHSRILETLSDMCPAGMTIFGNFVGGVSIIDIVVSAQELSRKFF